MAPRPESNPRETITAQVIVAGMTELMACARHDLIGPLNRAASLLELLIRRYRNELGAEGDRVLEFLLTTSARMEEVAAGIRRYIEIASAAPQSAVVDLNESVAGALSVLGNNIRESGATIETDSLPRVFADRVQMTTMFELLIGNSIRFSRPGSKPHIRISSVHDGTMEDVAVTDNGIGIDPEFADVIFQPFRRLNGADYAGAGLGLTTAKLIADLHGGSMRVVPTPDRGVSVHFTLPANERA
jgi:light-regulated signal transduction histidine kinase (bacteriophytochrome)